jgi:hypothetical protein
VTCENVEMRSVLIVVVFGLAIIACRKNHEDAPAQIDFLGLPLHTVELERDHVRFSLLIPEGAKPILPEDDHLYVAWSLTGTGGQSRGDPDIEVMRTLEPKGFGAVVFHAGPYDGRTQIIDRKDQRPDTWTATIHTPDNKYFGVALMRMRGETIVACRVSQNADKPIPNLRALQQWGEKICDSFLLK